MRLDMRLSSCAFFHSRLRIICIVLGVLITILNNCHNVNGHGRLMEPPNRSSLFRFSEYDSYEPEKNWNDMELWCGGLTIQYEQNGGKCGPCGDNYKDKRPRQNENGGIYGRAIIVRNYKPGQTIKLSVELTQYHKGHFEFSLCPLEDSNQLEEEECFEKYPLALADGSGFRYKLPRNESGWFNTTVKLPPGLISEHSVLRWHYRTGNRWDWMDDNHGTGGLGHGDQEIFRGCADISIGGVKPNTPRPPIGNYTSTTSQPTTATSSTTTTIKPTTSTLASTSKPFITTTRRPGTVPLPPRPLPPGAVSTPTTKRPGQAPIPVQRPPAPTTTIKPTTTTIKTTIKPSTTLSTITTTTTTPTTTIRPPTTTTTTILPSTSTSSTSKPSRPLPGHPMMRPPVKEAPKNKQE